MAAALNWESLTLGGSFAVGLLVGAFLTVRLIGVIARTLRKETNERDK